LALIRDVLLLQREELQRKIDQRYIKRGLTFEANANEMIKVILGPRRAGKSFFAIRTLSEKDHFGYANFDDESLTQLDDYNEIVAELNSLYNHPKILLFDEIQNLDRWELFVNRLQRQGYNLVLTGSNSNLLSKELATHLTGRHLPLTILPLAFKEIAQESGTNTTQSELKTLFGKYLVYGGYPEPFVGNMNYTEYLSLLFDSIIYKDIIKRHKLRKSRVIEDLAHYLISNATREISFNNLAKLTGLKSPHTVKNYVGYLQDAFLFFELERYSEKIKDQLNYNRKVYCVDNGFIRTKAFKRSNDNGLLYENLVAIELKRRSANGHFEFYYWKSQQQEEVDFVIKDGMSITELIQVCTDPSDAKTKKREIKALLKASKDLGCANLLVLTEGYEGEEESEWYGIKGVVRFIALWKWLLE
jgi:hypothetical protein